MPRALLRASWIAPLLALLALAPAAEAQTSTGPDFANVSDILQGRRVLYPVDDIVLSYNGASQPTTDWILTTANGNINGGASYTASATPAAQSFVVAAARFFNLPRAVVATVFEGATNVYDKVAGTNVTFPNAVAPSLVPVLSAVTDLVGNGYASMVFVSESGNGPTINLPGGVINTMVAANVDDPSQGFFYGTPAPLPADTLIDIFSGGIATGDFDGDGTNEIAVAMIGACVTACNGSGIVVAIYKPTVTTNAQGNVTALTLALAGSTTIQTNSPVEAVSLSAGKYLGGSTSQLALVYGNPGPAVVQPIAVSATSNPGQLALTPATPTTIGQASVYFVSAQSGPLDFFDTVDQLVVLLQSIEVDGGTLAVLTFDGQLTASVASSTPVPSPAGLRLGLALGNFDQPVSTTQALALQIAILIYTSEPGCAQNMQVGVQVYNVNPASGFAINPGLGATLSCAQPLLGLWAGIATGDTQGRALLLGPPSKIVAQHKQPEVVLGAPPMHVDFITPANGTSGPLVLNLSAVPQGFNSSYQTTVTNQTQSERQATTSYTTAVKTSDSVGVKFGSPLTGSVSAQVGISAGYMHDKTITKKWGTYTSTSFDASTTTGFDDQVWYSDKIHYVFLYPVIGKTACPSDEPNCTNPAPMVVAFSGPTITSLESVAGANLEWYQPTHEVGNVLSYPWSLPLLEATIGHPALLTSADPDGFETDGSTHLVHATWAGQQTTTSSTGSTSNISWGVSAAVTESAGIFGGIVGNQNFSYNGSVAISTLNTMTTKLGESTGIGISKPGTFANPPLYQYSVFPYIFGNNPVPGTLQDVALGTQIQTNGILRAAYTADPTNQIAGAWWPGAYTAPDVAVNHPSRWSIQLVTPSGAQPPNCIYTAPLSRNQACATFNPPELDTWTSEFHYMKGLLITPAGVKGEGPQLTKTVAGDPLLLRARVYNYSLVDVPVGGTIVVQFYGQPWHPHTLVPAGNAFLIDQVSLPPLPGFNSSTSQGTAPNWTVASTEKLDTTPYADQYLVFWVLVYIANAGGDLVPEVPGHGLLAVPPIFDSITDATAVLQPYSNNIGFYKSTFYVAAPGSTSTAGNPGPPRLEPLAVEVSAPRITLGEKVIVSAVVRSAEAVDGLSVLFRDGTATDPGKLFDVEDVSHVRANGANMVKVVYRPETCGTHVLSLQVANTDAAGQAPVQVTIDLARALDELFVLARRLSLPIDPLVRARAAVNAGTPSAAIPALQEFRSGAQAVLQFSIFNAPIAGYVTGKVDRLMECAIP